MGKTASTDGIKMLGKTPTARSGTVPDAGIPRAGKVTGSKGGSPGIRPANGSVGGARGVGSVHMGAKGSGHVSGESARAAKTYTGRKS
jgi:hypothetical protein